MKTSNTKKNTKLLKGRKAKTAKTYDTLKIVEGMKNSKYEYIPDYKVINRKAFSIVEMDLQKGQKVVAIADSMNYMDSHVKMSAKAKGGFWSSLKRSMFTTTSMFLNEYKGTDEDRNIVAFASPFLPEDIMPLLIKPGETIMIGPNDLLCFTDNLDIKTRARARGIFVDEGLFQSKIYNDSDFPGMVWLTAYGGYYKRTVKAGEKLKIDNGLFLCAAGDVNYDVSKVGSIINTMLSGEGFVMKFTGPCTVYCQGRSLDKFRDFIARQGYRE